MIENKLPVGIDRSKFILDTIKINGESRMYHLEKGEKVEILDVETGEMIGVSEFDMVIKGISLNNTDDYTIRLGLKKQSTQFALDVNIPKLLYNTNECNAHNIEHLRKINDIIEKKLLDYGVITDMSKARLSSLEINVNSTDNKLYNALKLIKKGLNTTDEKVFTVESKNNIETLMIKNNYIKIKVYDKVKQLEDSGQLRQNDSLIRLEVTTVDKRIIDVITNYNPTINGIIENWDKLEKWFIDTIDKQIRIPCNKFNERVIEEIVEQLKEGHKTYDILTLQAEKGNLVDVELFAIAMKKYYKLAGKKSPHSMIKNTKTRYEKINKKQYDTLVGNINALNNLWKQLGL